MLGRKTKPNSRRPGKLPPKQSVFSYYNNQTGVEQGMKRSDKRPSPTYSRASWWDRNWVRNLPSLIALSIITVSVLYSLGLSSDPKVVVSMSSPQAIVLRERSDYQKGAQRILQKSVLNKTKFTINSGGFEKAFRAEFPEVADVAIALPLVSRRPIVTISTAQPQIILSAQTKLYVLDKRGTVIMMANDLSSTVRQSLPVVSDQSGLAVEVGKTVLPADDVQFITTVISQLKVKNVVAESITLPKAANQVDIKPVGQPYYVKFSLDTNAREAAGSYLATKLKLEQMRVMPAQYIDVRVPGRAYYQ